MFGGRAMCAVGAAQGLPERPRWQSKKAPALGRCLGHVVLLDEIAGLEGDMAIEGDGEIGNAVAIGINLQNCL